MTSITSAVAPTGTMTVVPASRVGIRAVALGTPAVAVRPRLG